MNLVKYKDLFPMKSLVIHLIIVGPNNFMLNYELIKLKMPWFANASTYNKLIIYSSLDVSSMGSSISRVKSNGMAWFKDSPICSCTWTPLQVLGSKHLCTKCCEVALHHIAKFDADQSRVIKLKAKDLKIGVTCDCGVFVKLLKPCIIFTLVFEEPRIA